MTATPKPKKFSTVGSSQNETVKAYGIGSSDGNSGASLYLCVASVKNKDTFIGILLTLIFSIVEQVRFSFHGKKLLFFVFLRHGS